MMDKGDCPPIYGASYYIRELVALMDSQVTKEDYDRQVELLNNYVATSPCGIFIIDLHFVIECMEQFMKRINCIIVYAECMEKLLLISQNAPVLTKASDVVTFARDLEDYFSSLASILADFKQEARRDLVIVALHQLISKPYQERWRTPLEVRLEAAENSKLPEILAVLLLLSDEQLYPKLLNLIHLLGQKSDKSCKKFLLEDVLSFICIRFNPGWRNSHIFSDNITETDIFIVYHVPHFEDAYPVLCLLMEYLDRNPAFVKSVKCLSSLALWSLQDAFQYFTVNNRYSLERNAVLCFIFQLLQHFPKLDFVSSGLAESISRIFIFSSAVLKKKMPLIIQLTSSEEDYICLKLAFACLPYYLQSSDGIRILEDMEVMYSLLKIISNYKTVLLWPQEYSCAINLAAWEVLKRITPHLEDQFLEDGGPTILLQFIKHQDITRQNLITIDKCLNTLYYILKFESADLILQSIIYNDGLTILMGLTGYLIVNVTQDPLVHKCLQQCFCLLAKINPHGNDYYPHILSIFDKYLTKALHPAKDETVYDNKTLVCLIDLIWDSVIISKEFSTEFVKRGNVFLLLDVLQDCPLFAQVNILGLITDLLEQDECVPYLLTWRGHKRISFISLLMEIFRKENKQIMVKMERKGQIADEKHPLMGKDQWIATYCNSSILKGSPAITELAISCRPKIYAILTLLNTRHREQVEMVQEHYKYVDKLPPHDEATKLLAENFLALKLGEVWVEVDLEFKGLNFAPNPLDQKVMSSLVERFHKWSIHLKNAQNAVFKDQYTANRNVEAELYITLNNARVGDALDALAELKYIARCTERMFRLTQKYENNVQIDKHKKCFKSAKIHSTYMNEIRVTTVFNQMVSVKYTPKSVDQTRSGSELVSPIESLGNYKANADKLGGSCIKDEL